MQSIRFPTYLNVFLRLNELAGMLHPHIIRNQTENVALNHEDQEKSQDIRVQKDIYLAQKNMKNQKRKNGGKVDQRKWKEPSDLEPLVSKRIDNRMDALN